ncbi:GrpB-like predicted nucleotidyltransferase (UPF0157 family) [Nocardioides thalensis]|uniref:GrpB-like predicted nucleotidyltransferase (UPF0157 family) n=1 Tax=Nocardioides thalensis TaxID=1914755 RepID=A0A853BX62_9ACTN|nr:GrpB-like predicted nucleotidyltransferase (UPF0157 family) [Nocardioides thalensis]
MDHPVGLARGALELRPYSAEWPRSFERERSKLLANVPGILEVEHIGSTSVPGLDAKPIIDMQASLPSFDGWSAVVPLLVEHGYTYMAERVYDRRVFLPKGPEKLRTHYLSLIEVDTAESRLRLRFRDALRSDAALRREYRDLKWRLLREHAGDRPAYTAAKAAFVARVLGTNP